MKISERGGSHKNKKKMNTNRRKRPAIILPSKRPRRAAPKEVLREHEIKATRPFVSFDNNKYYPDPFRDCEALIAADEYFKPIFDRVWNRVEGCLRQYAEEQGRQIECYTEFLPLRSALSYTFIDRDYMARKWAVEISDDLRILKMILSCRLYHFLPWMGVQDCINTPIDGKGVTGLHQYFWRRCVSVYGWRNPVFIHDGDAKNIQYFLEAGANLHVKNHLGRSIYEEIMEAAMKGAVDADLFQFVLELGLDF